jgi:uncharacterized protein YjbI with pentapeptide repeats
LSAAALAVLLLAGCDDGGDGGGNGEASAAETETLATTPAEVRAECAETPTGEREDRAGAAIDDLTLTEPTGGPGRLRCAIFDGSTLRRTEFREIDLAGVSFRGADLTGSRFIGSNLVAADFTGARLGNVDFTDSDLRGAVFDQADLVGATMGGPDDALASASFVGARLGCGTFVGSPGMDLSGVTVVGLTACEEAGAPFLEMGLFGSFRNAEMQGFDFTSTVVTATDFQGAHLSGARLVDKGVWPDGADFSGADLTGADLSGTGFHEADFSNADLSSAIMTGTYVEASDFSGALFGVVTVPADLTGFESVSNRWRGATFQNVDMTGATFFRDDLTGAVFSAEFPNRLDGVVLTEVICPGRPATEVTPPLPALPSVRLLGTCITIGESRAEG